MGKAMTRLDNKMSCFLCCRGRWQLCQIVLLQADTRLIVIYIDTDRGFVLDLTGAKRYELMIEEDQEGKRQCRVKIKWDFGNVQLLFVEAQIGTWQKYVLDSFDRIFKTPIAAVLSRKRPEESACAATEQSSDDFSTTESGSSRRSSTHTSRLRHYPRLEDLDMTNDAIRNEACDEHSKTSSKTSQMELSRSLHACKHAPTLAEKYESPEGSDREAVETEMATSNEQLSKTSKNVAIPEAKYPNLDVQMTSGSSEDGSTLSMTSGTGSPSAYEGDISVVPGTITSPRGGSSTTYILPTPYNHATAAVGNSSPTRSNLSHVSSPRVASYATTPYSRQGQHQFLEEYDDDAAATSMPVKRSVKSIIARWPPNGPQESTA